MAVFNSDKIAKEFDLDDALDTLKDLRTQLETCENVENPNEILKSNIDRANRLLDKIEEAIEQGAIEPRLFEVAAQLINVSTQTANSMVTNSLGFENVRLKEEGLVIKEKEIDLKEQGLKHKISLSVTDIKPVEQQTTSFRGTREELLKSRKSIQ